MLVLAALVLLAEPAIRSPDHDCAGGAVIFFAPGSDRLDPQATELLAGYAATSRRQNADSQIYVESGGDGSLEGFDTALSRRRSEAIRAFLAARDIPPARIHIEVRELHGSHAPVNQDDAIIDARIGHVYEMVSLEEYRRLYPPGLIVECF